MNADDGLRAIMRKHLLARGFLLTPIETGGVTSGVGDVYWTNIESKAHGWIECKATSGWAVSFRPHQLGFYRRLVACGARSTVAVRARGKGSAGGRGDALWLLRGSAATMLSEKGLSFFRAGSPDLLGWWPGDPKTWPWTEIAGHLLGTR